MEQKLQMQKQHYEELTEKMDEISKMRHDMRHHLRVIMSYAQQEKYQEMMDCCSYFRKKSLNHCRIHLNRFRIHSNYYRIH